MNYVKKFSKINPNKPFLFSYRRCPYAMRARMALLSANISFDAYEISLRDKPLELLKLSSKGTVPVLLYKKQVIDESLEIMLWAYTNSEYSNHLKTLNQIQRVDADTICIHSLYLIKGLSMTLNSRSHLMPTNMSQMTMLQSRISYLKMVGVFWRL
jgi:glutathione S-transferase